MNTVINMTTDETMSIATKFDDTVFVKIEDKNGVFVAKHTIEFYLASTAEDFTKNLKHIKDVEHATKYIETFIEENDLLIK